MLRSRSPGPATILLRNRAISAACTLGSTHRATAGARATRPKTVTSPDPTDDHRHQLRPWTIRPRPPCLRRHRLVPAKRHATAAPPEPVLANHSPKQRKVLAPNDFHALNEIESHLLDFQQHYE